jgi:hypothetical protein
MLVFHGPHWQRRRNFFGSAGKVEPHFLQRVGGQGKSTMTRWCMGHCARRPPGYAVS